MPPKTRGLAILFLLVPVLFLSLSLLFLFIRVGPLGTWQGVLDTGITRFRIALVLQRDPDGVPTALFNNIDDGIYNQPFKTFWMRGWSFHGVLPTGEELDLSLSGLGFGGELAGTYTQAQGSYQQMGKVSSISLKEGNDFLIPRLGLDHQALREYQYQVPPKISDGWEVASLSNDKVFLEKMAPGIQRILNAELPHIHGLLVAKEGRLVLEEYFYGYGAGDLHPVQSITKSVVSLAFGIAQDKGWVSVGQKLYDFFPEYRSRPGWNADKNRITLGMLLTMRSGFQCDDWKSSQACSWDMVNSGDWLQFALGLPLENVPGRHFAYCGACLTPLSALLAVKSGTGLKNFAGKNLFEPLGIQTFDWMEGPGGITPASFGLSLKPRDLAKLGQLILNKGKWGGTQVVSEDWINRSTSVQVRRNHGKNEADYGYLWWEREMVSSGKKIRVLDGWGVGGQHLFVAPDLDLVCVITAGNYKDGSLGAQSIKFFQDYVLDR